MFRYEKNKEYIWTVVQR